MIPKINRGFSFKKLVAYLTHDKAADGQSRPDSAERVGFSHVLNFMGDAARGPEEAARIMALTWQSREAIKQAAGVGGGVSKAAPVWHESLAWSKGEKVDEAEMMRAVRENLSKVGLDLDKGYQTVIIQHRDTAHPHLHVVVNLIHPESGRKADPKKDQQKAQEWGRLYDKQRDNVVCHDREAKYAAIDARKMATATQAEFNDRAQGSARGSRPDAEAARRPRRSAPYPAWQARQTQQQQAKASADSVKATNDARYHGMRTRHEAAWRRRQQEIQQGKADAQAGKDAIYAKYATALDAIWKPQPQQRIGPDMDPWRSFQELMDSRKTVFDDKEQSLLGRLGNAARLLREGPRSRNQPRGLFAIVKLALDREERRKLFDRQQRRYFANNAPPRPERPRSRPMPATPDSKHRQAAQVKAMRAAELAAHEKAARAAAQAMAARHEFQMKAEAAEKAAHTRDSKAAWDAHREAFPREQRAPKPPRHSAQRPAAEQDRAALDAVPKAVPEAAPAVEQPAAKSDRFGRSRDRKPRAPRSARPGRGGPDNDQADGQGRDAGAEAANLTQEAGAAFEVDHPPPEQPEAAQRPENGQSGPVSGQPGDAPAAAKQAPETSQDQELAELQAMRRHMAERDYDDRHPGRERSRK